MLGPGNFSFKAGLSYKQVPVLQILLYFLIRVPWQSCGTEPEPKPFGMPLKWNCLVLLCYIHLKVSCLPKRLTDFHKIGIPTGKDYIILRDKKLTTIKHTVILCTLLQNSFNFKFYELKISHTDKGLLHEGGRLQSCLPLPIHDHRIGRPQRPQAT